MWGFPDILVHVRDCPYFTPVPLSFLLDTERVRGHCTRVTKRDSFILKTLTGTHIVISGSISTRKYLIVARRSQSLQSLRVSFIKFTDRFGFSRNFPILGIDIERS